VPPTEPGSPASHAADPDAEPGREPHRRSAGAVIGFTVLGVIPGIGLIAAGRRRTGAVVLVATLVLLLIAVFYVGTSTSAVLNRVFDTTVLREAAVVAVLAAVVWSAVIVLSHRALRPVSAGVAERVGGSVLVGVLCLAVSTPLVLGANVLLTTRQTLRSVFATTHSVLTGGSVAGGSVAGGGPVASSNATGAPTAAAHQWSTRRLNILIIGSDAAPDRTGTRTDSMAIASIDTVTGKVLLVSIPRNLCRLDWKPGTALAAIYPNGWTHSNEDCVASGDGDDLINAIYNDVPIQHPDVFPPGSTDNPGADALALGLEYSLGLPLSYYLLVDLTAFGDLVNATGGVTVNINTPIPVGGMHDALTGLTVTQYPTRWLMPGPNQHLDGKNALWFARGRFASDDYARIDRQKCMINAIIDQTSPTTLLTSYAALARTLQKDVRTNIPESLLDPLAQLGLKIRLDKKLASITIRPMGPNNAGIPGLGSNDDPDWAAARTAIAQAIAETDPTSSTSPSPGATSSTPGVSATAVPSGSSSSPTPAPAVSTTTASGADITEDVAAGCTYDPQLAAQNLAAWKGQWGGMYDDQGKRR
jgi:LCP family protein required for cell wall assembly